jgi:2-methylfumaryl-CoA hydratase
METAELPGRRDIGALRLRTVAAKDHACADFPDKGADGKPHPSVVLDLDYWVLMPR